MASLARKQNRNDIANFHYRKVIDLIQYNRDHFQASRFLGTAQFYLGDYQQAYVNLSKAVKIATRPADLWNMLGLIALRQGEPSKATDYFAKATISSPAILEYWFNLGLALTRENRFSDAEAAFRQALHVDVMDSPSHHGLAMALWNQGKSLDAVASWRDATTRDPKFWPSVYNLAWALATHPDPLVRNGPESLQLARRIVDNMKKPDALALEVLAAALAECGRFEEAIQAQERSLSMPFDDGGTIVTGPNRDQRLELYRQGKSWRMTTTNPQQSHTN
jgi:tetratricopeptide (TPR) repeat protein